MEKQGNKVVVTPYATGAAGAAPMLDKKRELPLWLKRMHDKVTLRYYALYGSGQTPWPETIYMRQNVQIDGQLVVVWARPRTKEGYRFRFIQLQKSALVAPAGAQIVITPLPGEQHPPPEEPPANVPTHAGFTVDTSPANLLAVPPNPVYPTQYPVDPNDYRRGVWMLDGPGLPRSEVLAAGLWQTDFEFYTWLWGEKYLFPAMQVKRILAGTFHWKFRRLFTVQPGGTLSLADNYIEVQPLTWHPYNPVADQYIMYKAILGSPFWGTPCPFSGTSKYLPHPETPQ